MANDTLASVCSILQKSISHCEGAPVIPGVRRRGYYIAKKEILSFASVPVDSNGRPTSSEATGNFVLEADKKWHYIDFDPAKSKLASTAQGEYPSQTQLNDFTGIIPDCGPEACAAAAYLNNCDNVMLIPDAQGRFHIVGSEYARSTTTVEQDFGEGPTGTASTTVHHTATDIVCNPIYKGLVDADDGKFMADGSEVSEP